MARDIFVGSVSVGVVPDATGWNTKLRDSLVPSSNVVGQEVGQNISSGIVDAISAKEPDMAAKGTESADAFGKAFQEKIKAALDALPEAKIDADSTPADEKVDELRRKLEELRDEGLDLGSDKAMEELSKVSVGLDEVANKSKDIRLTFDTAEARAQLDALAADVKAKTSDASSGGILGSISSVASRVAPGLTEIGGGAGLLGAGGAALAAVSPFAAAGTAVGAFGALAMGEITKVNSATKANTTAQTTYNNAVKTATASYQQQMAAAQQSMASATTAAQRQSALNAEQKAGLTLSQAKASALKTEEGATTKLSGSQQSLANSIQELSGMWNNLETQMAPVIASVASMVVKIAQDLMPVIGPLVTAGAKIITDFLAPLDQYFKSVDFDTIIGSFVKFGEEIAKMAGPQMTQLLAALLTLFVDLMPAGVQIMSVLLPLLVQIVVDLTPFLVVVAKVVAATLDWLDKTHLLIPVLALLGAVLLGVIIAVEGASAPIWLIVAAIIAVIVGITELVKNWSKIWAEIQAITVATWHILYSTVFGPMVDWFTKSLPHAMGVCGTYIAGWCKDVGNAFLGMWRWTVTNVWNPVLEFFTKTFPHWLDMGINFVDLHWVKPFNNAMKDSWQWVYNNVWTPVWNFFMKTLPNWFDEGITYTQQHWCKPFEDAMVDSWQWVYNNVWLPVKAFFTQTLPGWFDTGANAVGKAWDKVKGFIATPIQWVGKNVLVHLFNAIDDVTNFVGLGKPLQATSNSLANIPTAAAGMYVANGAGPKIDDQLALLARGEVVVPTNLVEAGAVDHLRGFIPGFSTGGSNTGTAPVSGTVADGSTWIHIPGMGNAPYDWIPIPGFAAGGQASGAAIEQAMLNFMISKRGQAYSEANRWGEPPWDCSSLVWTAANSAGVPIPKSSAIANTEAEWLSGWGGSYAYRDTSEIQTGDILFSSGASPDPSPWGGIGHVGMAASPSVLISALGTQYGVTESGIGGLTVGIRLGGKGGKSLLSRVFGFIGGVVRSLTDIFSGLGKDAGIAIDLAKGNVAGALSSIIAGGPKGVNGTTAGEFAKVLTTLPTKLASDLLNKIVNDVKSFATAQQSSGGGGTPVNFKAGAGVSQWTSVVQQALALNGLPASLANQVLYQMQTESGGNPNAVNNWDINAKEGDPSKGLLQVIGATFSQYHVAGTSDNIFDPLANTAAAIAYAKARYGPTLMSGGMGMGSGHGYDDGGWLPPGATMAFNNTGRHELVLSPDQLSSALSGGSSYHAHFDGLTGQAIEGHVRTAFQAMSITQGHLQRQGRRH